MLRAVATSDACRDLAERRHAACVALNAARGDGFDGRRLIGVIGASARSLTGINLLGVAVGFGRADGLGAWRSLLPVGAG